MTEYIQKHELFLKRYTPKSFYFCSQNLVPFREVTEFLNSNNTNELLIYGGSGVGKTHLIGCTIQNTFISSLYIDSSDFISTFYKHLKLKTPLQAIFDWLLSFELLIFDSFQLVRDKPIIKEVISILLKQFNKQKVIFIWTSEDEISDYFGSEFTWNVTKHLRLPEPSKNCLKTISEHFFLNNNKNIKLTDNAFELISETIRPDFRSLMDVLTKLLFLYSDVNTPTTLGTDEIKEFLNKINAPEAIRIDPERAMELSLNKICQKLEFDSKMIREDTKSREVVFQRDLVIYLLKKEGFTHEQIGKFLNRGASSISKSLERVRLKITKNRSFKRFLDYF